VVDTDTDILTDAELRQRFDLPWEVVLWNDPVSLISLVVRVLQQLFGYDLPKAERLTMAVHHEGKAVVWTGEKDKAAAFCVALHGYALAATIQPSQ
jgi:ATP-dependent Clp protease adaptor protein ClpS